VNKAIAILLLTAGAMYGSYITGKTAICNQMASDVSAGQLAGEVVYDPKSPCMRIFP
jgi:hypothetical protein